MFLDTRFRPVEYYASFKELGMSFSSNKSKAEKMEKTQPSQRPGPQAPLHRSSHSMTRRMSSLTTASSLLLDGQVRCSSCRRRGGRSVRFVEDRHPSGSARLNKTEQSKAEDSAVQKRGFLAIREESARRKRVVAAFAKDSAR